MSEAAAAPTPITPQAQPTTPPISPATGATSSAAPAIAEPDLDAIDRDLDGVERALSRLAEGTYWTDETTGETLDPAMLDDDPIARRAPVN